MLSGPPGSKLIGKLKGANQKCCSIKGTKKLLRRRHKINLGTIIVIGPRPNVCRPENRRASGRFRKALDGFAVSCKNHAVRPRAVY
jgi:hypothetical protein